MRASSVAWRTASLAVGDPSVPTTIASNIGSAPRRRGTALLGRRVRRERGGDVKEPRAVARVGPCGSQVARGLLQALLDLNRRRVFTQALGRDQQRGGRADVR